MPLEDFVKNMFQRLKNPGFSLIQVKKCSFSKEHIFGTFILVSWFSHIMLLASFKSKLLNVFYPAIFMHFRMVCDKAHSEVKLRKVTNRK